MDIHYSQYQLKIFEFIKTGKGNALINAVAGSGKTTTIVKAIELIEKHTKKDIAFLAFNRHIADDLKKKIKSKGIAVTTMHAMGLHLIQKALNGKRPDIGKHTQYVKRHVENLAVINQWCGEIIPGQPAPAAIKDKIKVYSDDVSELISLCKANLATDFDAIKEVSVKYGLIKLGDIDFQRIEKIFVDLYTWPDLRKINFDDMIFLPAMSKVSVFEYDFVFVDECQDLNKAQQMLISKLLKPTSRLIAVGDPRQAINGFAGADTESYDSLAKMPNMTHLELSFCYRCARPIVEFAQTLNSKILPHPNAQMGFVGYGSYTSVTDGDFVLCRFNAPLIKLFFTYLRRGQKAKVKGKDIGRELVGMIEHTQATSIAQLFARLDYGLNQMLLLLIREGETQNEAQGNMRYSLIKDKIDCLRVMSETCNDIEQLKEKVTSIFDDDIEGITLSSIHKSKGLEADNVFILGDDYTPASQAKAYWEIQQEENLMYVAYTRAKKRLIFINDYEEINPSPKAISFQSSRFEDYQFN